VPIVDIPAAHLEQIEAVGVYSLRAPTGHFLFGVSMQTTDFFQNEAKRCRDNAERATKKDREFWLTLARRWEELLQARNESDANVEAVHTLRPQRTMYNKRRRVA